MSAKVFTPSADVSAPRPSLDVKGTPTLNVYLGTLGSPWLEFRDVTDIDALMLALSDGRAMLAQAQERHGGPLPHRVPEYIPRSPFQPPAIPPAPECSRCGARDVPLSTVTGDGCDWHCQDREACSARLGLEDVPAGAGPMAGHAVDKPDPGQPRLRSHPYPPAGRADELAPGGPAAEPGHPDRTEGDSHVDGSREGHRSDGVGRKRRTDAADAGLPDLQDDLGVPAEVAGAEPDHRQRPGALQERRPRPGAVSVSGLVIEPPLEPLPARDEAADDKAQADSVSLLARWGADLSEVAEAADDDDRAAKSIAAINAAHDAEDGPRVDDVWGADDGTAALPAAEGGEDRG